MSASNPFPPTVDPMLTDVEVARLTGHAPQTLRRYRHQFYRGGDLHGPKFIRLGSCTIRYRLSDVQSYLAECERRTGIPGAYSPTIAPATTAAASC